MPETRRARPTTFLVGAGISRNSGAPTFDQFWKAFLRAVHMLDPTTGDDQLERLIEVFPPEQLFYRLARIGPEYETSINATLLRYLSDHLPNRNHRALAHALRDGASVWTTNYDTLIEDAYAPFGEVHVLATPDGPNCDRPGCNSAHLYKPHGTFRSNDPTAQQLIYQSDAALAGLPKEWQSAAREAFSGRATVVAGYSGNDIDIMAIYLDAATSPGDWYEKPGPRADRAEEILPTIVTIHRDDPSSGLQREIADRCRLSLAEFGVDPEHTTEVVAAVGFPLHLFGRASLESHLEDPAIARRTYRRSVLHDPWRLKARAASRVVRSAVFDLPRPNRIARTTSQAAMRLAPFRSRQLMAWRYYLLASEGYGATTKVGAQIIDTAKRIPVEDWGQPTRTSAASLLKLVGRLDLVEGILHTDLDQLSPSELGKVVFNLLWTLRNRGDLQRWEETWARDVSRGPLMDPNWAAWLWLEAADQAAMVGDLTRAEAALATVAVDFAAHTRKHPRFLVDVDASRARNAALGEPDSDVAASMFDELLQRLDADASLDTGFRRASFSIARASVRRPELDRQQLRALIECSELRTCSELHHVIAGLLRHRHRLDPIPKVATLLNRCRTVDFGYGEALIIREVGLPDADAHLRGATEFLPHWDSSPTVWVVP